jgi:hypothetical protein
MIVKIVYFYVFIISSGFDKLISWLFRTDRMIHLSQACHSSLRLF